jgi:hypothetical protein
VRPLGWLLVAAACGGRTELGTLVSNGDNDAAAGDGGLSNPCEVDGIRLCGPGCPPLGDPTCCTATFDRDTRAPTKAGVCWTDLSDKGQRPCIACKDGEVCAYRASDRLVCVPLNICRALDQLGARQACRYADKSAYDGRPLASRSDCPLVDENGASLKGQHFACGGGCGDCASGVPCTGRSADRPFGFCPLVDNAGTSPDHATQCSTAASCQVNAQCVRFSVDLNDQSEANVYGVCGTRCKAISIGESVTCH